MSAEQDIIDMIRNARICKGFTQEFVAEQIHLSAKAYSKIETGRNRLSIDNLQAVCDVLDIPYYLILQKYCPIFKSADSDICACGMDMSNDEWAFVQLLSDYTGSDISDILELARELIDIRRTNFIRKGFD